VLVWLLQSVLRAQYGFTARASAGLICWSCGALAIGLSLLQLPILMRGFDATDILFRLLGVAVGLATHSAFARGGEPSGTPRSAERWGGFVRVGCAATFGYIVYIGVIPLTFSTAHGGPAAAISSKGFLPFFAYFLTRFDVMMDDVLEKFVSYALFAALLSACWKRVAVLEVRSRVLAVSSVGVALSCLLEVVQMFIPVRVAGLTDPILCACACVVGVLAKEHAVALYQFAVTHEMFGPQGLHVEQNGRAALSPTDAMIAGLTEPYPEAPEEPALQPKPTSHR
jgi:hypothetical protein